VTPARHTRTLAVAVLLAALGGCAQWQSSLPRIDPSGERLFLPPQPTPPAAPAYADPLGGLGNVDAPPVLSAPALASK